MPQSGVRFKREPGMMCGWETSRTATILRTRGLRTRGLRTRGLRTRGLRTSMPTGMTMGMTMGIRTRGMGMPRPRSG